MTRRKWFRVGGCLALAVFGPLLAAPGPGHAQSATGPRPGTYKIVLVQLTTGTVTSHLVLRADGTYQVFDLNSKEPRGSGTWRYDAAARRVFWLTGLNNEMGRGGAFTVEHGGRIHRISMGRQVYAINGD
jgi:hypothetical protein